jgi:hypothetical protein
VHTWTALHGTIASARVSHKLIQTCVLQVLTTLRLYVSICEPSHEAKAGMGPFRRISIMVKHSGIPPSQLRLCLEHSSQPRSTGMYRYEFKTDARLLAYNT